jgi:hypothetical protein
MTQSSEAVRKKNLSQQTKLVTPLGSQPRWRGALWLRRLRWGRTRYDLSTLQPQFWMALSSLKRWNLEIGPRLSPIKKKIWVLKNFLTNSENLISTNFSSKSENFPDKFFGAASWQDFFRFFLRIFDSNTIWKICGIFSSLKILPEFWGFFWGFLLVGLSPDKFSETLILQGFA